MNTVHIRPILPEDANTAARLSTELGYPVNAGTLRERIERLPDEKNHAVLVYSVNGEVAGWIDLTIEQHLQSEPAALIGGLVVTEAMRNRGIGRQLCEAAEQWAREQGVARLRVRSNAIREQAHAFYLRDGYTRVKTSAVFEKTLI